MKIKFIILIIVVVIVVLAGIIIMTNNNIIVDNNVPNNAKVYMYLCTGDYNGLNENSADCACYTKNAKNYFSSESEAQNYCCNQQDSVFLKDKFGCA